MPTYYAVLTNAGQAQITAAIASGTPVNWTQMAVGDGNGNPTTPNASQTALVREVFRANLNRIEQDPNNTNRLVVELIIPEANGGWTIREGGIFDGSGNMVAVCNFPPTYKPAVGEGSASDVAVRMNVFFENTSAVTLIIDPGVVMASRQWVIDNFSLADLLPGGTTGQILRKASNADGDTEWVDPGAGITILVNSVEETQTLAASQTVVNWSVITANGLAVYIDGVRLRKTADWTQTGPAQITLATSWPAGTKITGVQNEEAGELIDPLQASNNLSDVENVATARTNLNVYSKQEVADLIEDRPAKASCRLATTANLVALSGLQTIDGVTLVANDRVLVKNQTTASQNGIYVAASGAWTRATDFDSGDVRAGDFVYVTEGATNADTGWLLITNNPITIGTTALSFTKTYGSGQFVLRSGDTITGDLGVQGVATVGSLIQSSAAYSVPTATAVTIDLPTGGTNLAAGYSYRFRLNTLATGTNTGAEYVIYQTAAGVWSARIVSANGLDSNHPRLQVSGTTVQVLHSHASTYSVAVNCEAFFSGNTAIVAPHYLGLGAVASAIGSNLLIGYQADDQIHRLQVNGDISGTSVVRLGALTDSVAKLALMAARHYLNAEESISVINGNIGASTSLVDIGGGLSSFNAATQVRIFTAANNNTLIGTERLRVTGSGAVLVGTGVEDGSTLIVRGANSGLPTSSGVFSNGAAFFGVASGNVGLAVGTDSGNSRSWLQSINRGTSAAATLLVNPNGGNVLVGGSNDDGSNRLQVSGTASIDSGATDQVLRLNGTGNPFIGFFRSGVRHAYIQSSSAGVFINSEQSLPFAIQTNGTSRIYVPSSGNVLIGTTTDDGANKLQVSGSVAFSSTLAVRGTKVAIGSAGSGTGGGTTMLNDAGAEQWRAGILGTVGATAFTIYNIPAARSDLTVSASNGNVIIGTGSDDGSNKLQVNGGIRVFGQANIGGPSGAGRLNLFASDNVQKVDSGLGVLTGDTNAYGLTTLGSAVVAFGTASTERMRISTAGNVLVGKTSDDGTNKIQIAGTGTVYNRNNTEQRIGWQPAQVAGGASRAFTAADCGQTVDATSGATYTINTGLGADGDLIQIENYSAGSITIAAGAGVTLEWLKGGSSSTGNRTVAAKSIVTVKRRSSTLWTIYGNGIS